MITGFVAETLAATEIAVALDSVAWPSNDPVMEQVEVWFVTPSDGDKVITAEPDVGFATDPVETVLLAAVQVTVTFVKSAYPVSATVIVVTV